VAFLEIRVPTVVAVLLIVLGLPASGAFLLFGVAHLVNPEGGFHGLPAPFTEAWWGVVAALAFCGMGVFLLLMAIAAFRGILHRNKS
jgi:hypothetical protein